MARDPFSAVRALSDLQSQFATYSRRRGPGFFGGRTEVASPVSPLGKGAVVPVTKQPESGGGGGSASYIRVAQDSGVSGAGAGAGPLAWELIENQAGSALSWDISDPAKVVCEEAGVYLMTAVISFYGSTSGIRYAECIGSSGASGSRGVIQAPSGGVTDGVSVAWLTPPQSVGHKLSVTFQTGGGALWVFGQLQVVQIA